jgi:hypothetical protein
VNKQQAVKYVAAHLAGLLQGGTFEESVGHGQEWFSEADVERLGEAIEVVMERLHRMGAEYDEDAVRLAEPRDRLQYMPPDGFDHDEDDE